MLPKFGRKRMRTWGEVKRRTFLSAVGAGAFAGCSGLGGSTPDSSRQWTVDQLSQEKLVGAHYYLWYQGSGGYGPTPTGRGSSTPPIRRSWDSTIPVRRQSSTNRSSGRSNTA